MTTKVYSIEDIKNMIYEILIHTDVEKAILFGSYAKNEPTENSDIDILIDSKGKMKGLKFFAMIDLTKTLMLSKNLKLIKIQKLKKKSKKQELLFMKSKDKVILTKVLNYIDEIGEFIEGYTQKQFSKDRKTVNACVFDLSQIGELVGKISEETIKENPNIEWRGLKALRNRIVHDYEGINLNMVWGFLDTELEELKIQIENIIN